VFDAVERRKPMDDPYYVSVPKPSLEIPDEARQRKTLSELEQAEAGLLARAEEKIVTLEKQMATWNQATKLSSGGSAAAVPTLIASHSPQSGCLNVNFSGRAYRLVFRMVGEKADDYLACYLRTHVERRVEKFRTDDVLLMEAGERWKMLNGQRYLDRLGNVYRDTKDARAVRQPEVELVGQLLEAILADSSSTDDTV
jgi:hypothetical protein